MRPHLASAAFLLALALALAPLPTAGLPAPVEEDAAAAAAAAAAAKLLDKEVASWLLGMARRARYEANASASPLMCIHKRNSEIINSLLGLPKVLNDAGRK